MQRFKYSILAAAGILVLSSVLIAIGPTRVMAALGYTPVRDVDNPGRQPVQFTLTPPGDFQVPVGKRLIIDHVTGTARITGGQRILSVNLVNNLQGTPGLHFLPVSFNGSSGGSDYYTIAERTAIYTDGPNFVQGPAVTFSGGSLTIQLTISGHYVDMP